jgi:23S rRNA (cytidine1920-2'-O)/16S rRNA (cytidine1409-2'-O)-methyltransferase
VPGIGYTGAMAQDSGERSKQPAKTRLDVALVERGLAETRAAAQRLVMAGLVFSGERRLDKPGAPVAAHLPLEVRGQPHPYVSRGGLKLARGLDAFSIPVAERLGLDVGASTGGFTDVLLQRGAARVYAVDVGHGQLAWKLRQDPRVVVLERTNIRNVGRQQIADPVDLIVSDVSFIGLRTALPAALALAAPGAHLLALIKPQFEVGKGRVGKGGIVRDPALHAEVCATIGDWLAAYPGWRVLGITDSPIEGADGNREFLIGGTFEG